ncbi:unnamed protein product [Lactuca saligna]|uniref:Uncharacterized protein n=1 Tax=Lactuca saligna TaxID=75948 RepID=A0AA35Z6Q5_LACSI|nr:unnamed protein product [Lactuca saligna]
MMKDAKKQESVILEGMPIKVEANSKELNVSQEPPNGAGANTLSSGSSSEAEDLKNQQVDTNVGRIAVRPGWVPLQPLPESLQLHLLEMYPVLHSIQKYLWPRLCKLDQLTLYELHYQMITFGKFFCTKSKPSHNACPMRAECRNFASAFASARLALPGPEEKKIVASNAHIPTDRAPYVVITPLPLPEAGNKTEGDFEKKCEPIIEEQTTPQPEAT